nr:cytochrome P450 CYP82D47-like [Ipomoea batatas]
MELLQDLHPSLVFLAIALSLCVVIHHLAHNNKSGKQKLPPEAAAGWPILGHLHIFSGSKLAHVELGNMADKYGPAFTIRIGVHRALVVSDWKLVKELSTVHDVHISSRPKFRAAEHLGYNYIMFAFTPYGQYWRDIRKFVSTELLSNRRLEQRKHIRVSEIDTSIKELYKLWTENKNFGDPSGRVLVEMKKWFGDITVNVFLQMMAGKRYFRTATVSDERDGRRCKKALRDFFHYLGVFAPADALPFLGGLDIGGYEKTMKEVAKEMDSLVDDWLQEHRRKKVAAGDGSNGGEEDFIDAMLSRLEEIDRNGYNADSVIKSTCMQAGGAWPILGHLHIFSGSKLPHVALGNMADKYGPAFTIRIGVHRALVVSDWKLAKHLSTVHDVHISTRPKFRAAKHLGYDYIMFAFSPYGPYWRQMRKLTSTELLSTRRLEQLKHIRVAEIETSVKELYKVWTEKNKKPDHSGRVVVEMKKLFGDITFNVFLQMVVGKRYFGTRAAGDEKQGRRCQKALRDFFNFLGVFVPADALPFLGRLDIGGYEKAMKEVAKEMDSLVEEWLQEHRLKKETKEEDFIDAMLSQIEGIDLNGFSVDSVIKSTCMTLMAGGADTVTTMLTWALSLMMNHLHVLKMAQEELDRVVGKERRANESDIKNLMYLQAVVKEALRLYPAGPLGAPRIFTKDCTLSEFHIPNGTWLFINIWKIQRDPQVWSSPDEFKPERFINSHKDYYVLGQDFELIPFGVGRRICPGTNFGLQMLHLVLANLLHSFELSNVSNRGIDMTEKAGLTNVKATPLEILIAPRLSAYLY